MMKHPEASIYMNYAVNLVKRNLLKDGYAFPIIVAYTKGEDRKPNLVHELLSAQARYVLKNMALIDEEEFDPNPEERVYAYLYLLHFENVEDENQIEYMTKMIARTGNPDVIGYLCSCAYNVYKDADNVELGKVLTDPEASRVLFASYYLNGDPKRRDLASPFINRGGIKQDPLLTVGDTAEKYEVLAAHSSWYIPTPADARKMKNPYDYK